MQRRLKKLLFILVLFLFACQPGAEKRRDAFFEKGKEQYEAGNFAEARAELKNALKIDPNFTNGRNLLGLCYLQASQLDETNLDEAVEPDPAFLQAQLEIGSLFMKAEAHAEAKEDTKPAKKSHNMDAEHLGAEVVANRAKRDQAKVKSSLEEAVVSGTRLLEQTDAFKDRIREPADDSLNASLVKGVESAIALLNGKDQDTAPEGADEDANKHEAGLVILLVTGMIGLLGFRIRSSDED